MSSWVVVRVTQHCPGHMADGGKSQSRPWLLSSAFRKATAAAASLGLLVRSTQGQPRVLLEQRLALE